MASSVAQNSHPFAVPTPPLAMLAAADGVGHVLSLTVIDPSAFTVAVAGHAAFVDVTTVAGVRCPESMTFLRVIP